MARARGPRRVTPGRTPPPAPHSLALCLSVRGGETCPDRDFECSQLRAKYRAEFRDLEQRRLALEALTKFTVERILRSRGQ